MTSEFHTWFISCGGPAEPGNDPPADPSSPRFLATLIETIPSPIFFKDSDGRYLGCNAAFEAFLGLPRERIVGRTVHDIAPRNLADIYASQDRALLEGRGVQVYESQVRYADGTDHDVVFHKAVFSRSDGSPAGMVGLMVDITDRKAQEQELLRLNRLYNLLSQLGQCLVQVRNRQELFDRSCAIAAREGDYPLAWIALKGSPANPARAIAMAGPLAPALEEGTIRIAISPDGGGLAATSLWEGRTAVFQEFEDSGARDALKGWARNAGLRSGVAVPFRLHGEVVGSFIAFAREAGAFPPREVDLLERAVANISFGLERFGMEEEKAILQEQLHQAQKMESLGTLAGGIAHDMNNVLGAILALASTHLEAMPQGDPLRPVLDTIVKASTRGGRMVKGLLDFSRKRPTAAEILDLNDLAVDVANLLERTTLTKVQVAFSLAPSLHPIQGDPSALVHAILNLCVNAVDAMDQGGTLTLATRNLEDRQVELLVRDTGSGMSAEVLRKAMDPFFTTKPQGKGTGLGLPIVYGVVKGHHGDLRIQSDPGKGTEVILRFPAVETGPAGEPQAGKAEKAGFHRLPPALVVDDDDFMRKAIASVFELMGEPAALASSGEEALSILRSGAQPGLVVLDLNMPGLSGAETLRRIRDLRPETPVLLVTGKADSAAHDLARTWPRVSLLAKPFSSSEFQARVANLTQN